MNRIELIRAIADDTGFSAQDVREVMNSFQRIVYETFLTEPVKFMSGLTLDCVQKKGRLYKDPRNNIDIIDARKKWYPRVIFGAPIKERVNEYYNHSKKKKKRRETVDSNHED